MADSHATLSAPVLQPNAAPAGSVLELELAYLRITQDSEFELEFRMSSEESAAFWSRWGSMLEVIADTPAHTPAEIAAKARTCRAEKDSSWGDALLDSLCEDLERHAAG